jgi:hypothetical protein
MTQQPEPPNHIAANHQEESRAIDKPPDKESPAPVGDRDGRKFERYGDEFEHPQTTKNEAIAQALIGGSGGLDLYDAGRAIGRGPSDILQLCRRYQLEFPVCRVRLLEAVLNEWGQS